MKRRNLLKAGLSLPLAQPLSNRLGMALALALTGAPARANERKASGRIYAPPDSTQRLQLPRDHGPHPDFRTEWWYFTGWFESPGLKEPLGLQITFFRSAPNIAAGNPSAFAPSQLLFAHAAVALPSQGKLKHEQIIRRAGSGGALIEGNASQALNIRMPGWALSTPQGDEWLCSIQTPQLGMNLRMAQSQSPWLQGSQGFSQKGPLPQQSSHYITLPHMACSGTLRLADKTFPVKGSFWMDHEWSSTVLADNAQGWDWVGLHGQQGDSLMAFRIRNRNPQESPVWTHAALRNSEGQVQRFNTIDFQTLRTWKSSRTGIEYPVAQRIFLDDQQFDLEPLFDDQELDARASTGTLYWEGAVRVKTGSGLPWGQGYLEMTGYDRPMQL